MPESLVRQCPEDVAITAAVQMAMQTVGNLSLEAGPLSMRISVQEEGTGAN